MGESNLETEPNLADIESSVHSGDSALLESEGEMKKPVHKKLLEVLSPKLPFKFWSCLN